MPSSAPILDPSLRAPGALPSASRLPAPGRTRPLRVVALVRNAVTSDFRVLKTSRELQRLGFESVALGWTAGGEAPLERDSSGMEIYRAAAGRHFPLTIRLVRAALQEKRSFREILQNPGAPWLTAALETFEAKARLTGSSASRPSSAEAEIPLPEVIRAASSSTPRKNWRRIFRSVLRRACSFLLPPGRLGLTERHKMMHFIAETFWDLYPPLLASRPDIIHAHELSALLPAIIAGRRLGVPVIYDSHELEFARNSPWLPETFAFWQDLERDLIPYADSVIAVSEGCAQAIRERYGLPQGAVTVIRNCPSNQRWRASRSLRQVTGLPPETPLLVFVGKLARHRGLELLLTVLRRLPGFHLACVGHEDPSFRQSLEQRAATAGVRDRIHFVPPVAGNEVVEFIAEADVSVMPIRDICLSYRHCLPNKLLESAHAGIPVVASALPDMQSFLRRYEIGLAVEGEDPAAWAEAIQKAYQQRQTFYDTGKLERIRRESCAEAEVAQIASLYQNILDEPVLLAS